MDNNFILEDRLQKIRQVINSHGENLFYIAFSGGRDSCVLSKLVDLAIPNNKIPRVYVNTGIELNLMIDFVKELQKEDDRIIIQPKLPIKKMLEENGYPFKSKMHSNFVDKYQRKGFEYKSVRAYTEQELTLNNTKMFRPCPKKLKYQFTPDFNLRVSDKCCLKLKEEPMKQWAKDNGRKYPIMGIMASEGGRRYKAQCLVVKSGYIKAFQPMAPLSNDWENWFINEYNIKLCKLYYSPYNFTRTGCKGCPFALDLEKELDILEQYFPNERKQCEIIWKPVYDEYRRINYRLKGEK